MARSKLRKLTLFFLVKMVDINSDDFPRSEKGLHIYDGENEDSIEPTQSSDSEDACIEDWEIGLQRYTLQQQVQLCRSYARHANNKLRTRQKRRKLMRQDAMDGLENIRQK